MSTDLLVHYVQNISTKFGQNLSNLSLGHGVTLSAQSSNQFLNDAGGYSNLPANFMAVIAFPPTRWGLRTGWMGGTDNSTGSVSVRY